MTNLAITDYGRPDPPRGERVWSTDELQQDFEVLGFSAPFVVVRRKADGVKGTLEFTHRPRWHFGFEAAS